MDEVAKKLALQRHVELRGPFPHEGACSYCRAEKRCNCCGQLLRREDGNKCTNGRCGQCHANACTPGGNATPGHGFGTREAQIAAMRKALSA